MRKAGLLIAWVISGWYLQAQPYSIGHTTITFTDAARNNRQVATEIYYPAMSAGDNVPVAVSSSGKFPVISFGHGFLMSWEAYENIWNMLVPEGYIVALPKTEGSTSPSHSAFGADLVFVIQSLSSLSDNSNSFFYNCVDTMNCVMGHSMGGGAALLGATNSSLIKATATLTPAETNPSAIQAAGSVRVPSLVIAGENDCVTPVATNQLPMYDNLGSSCKIFVEIKGGSHCQMADNNFICDIGESTCQPEPAISPAVQHAVIRRYLLPWLHYHLKGVCASGTEIENLLPSDSQISFRKECAFCTATGDNRSTFFSNALLYPNPAEHTLLIQLPGTLNNKMMKIELLSPDGRFLSSFNATLPDNRVELQLPENLPPGTYIIKIFNESNVYVQRFIKGL